MISEEQLKEWERHARIFLDRSTNDGTVYIAKSDETILSLIEEVRFFRDGMVTWQNAAIDLGEQLRAKDELIAKISEQLKTLRDAYANGHAVTAEMIVNKMLELIGEKSG